LDNIELQFARMSSPDVSALIVNDEESRRVADMMEIYGYIRPDDPAEKEKHSKSALLLNMNNSAVQFLCASADEGDVKAEFAAVANQLFDFALLSQQLLNPEDMAAFISRSEAMLEAYVNTL
jgi:molecular chaperone HtpG